MRRPAGFSLLEVVLALGILAGAMVVLGELARQGLQHARSTRDLAQAELICESKMAEIAAGLVAPETVAESPVEADPSTNQKWLYSIDVIPVGEEGLLSVCVTVTDNTAGDAPTQKVSLTRWMVDPEWTPSTQTAMDQEMQVDLGAPAER